MRVLAMILAFALAAPLAAQEGGRMTVSGEATVLAVPDMAVISLGAVGTGATPAEAMNITSTAVDAIVARLAQQGVDARDIQTTSLRISEMRRWDQNREIEVFEGYQSDNLVEVRLRDLESLGETLAAVLDDGVNRMQNLRFAVQEPRKLEDEARRRAVSDARIKAALYAEAAGVELDGVLSLSDVNLPSDLAPGRRAEPVVLAEERAASVPLAAGEIEVTARVTMQFRLSQ